MHMVWHDAPCVQVISLPVEMPKRSGCYFGIAGFAKYAGAMPLVQISFDKDVLHPSNPVKFFGLHVALLFQGGNFSRDFEIDRFHHGAWQGIVEPERDKIGS